MVDHTISHAAIGTHTQFRYYIGINISIGLIVILLPLPDSDISILVLILIVIPVSNTLTLSGIRIDTRYTSGTDICIGVESSNTLLASGIEA